MSGAFLQIDLDLSSATAGISGLVAGLTDLRPMLEDVGAELESSTLNRFETNLDPEGVPWPQSLHAQLTGKPTLVDEGFLRDSVHYELDGDSAVMVGAGGIASKYAAIHQTGGTITAKTAKGLSFSLADGSHHIVQSVTLPKRSYLGLSTDDGQAILAIVSDHLVGAAARTFQGAH